MRETEPGRDAPVRFDPEIQSPKGSAVTDPETSRRRPAGNLTRALAFLSPVLLSACLPLAGCIGQRTATPQPAGKAALVSPAGGVVSISSGVDIKVAAGTAKGTTVRGQAVPNPPAYPGGIAVLVGSPVDIMPSGPLAASTVLLSFNPATDLPRARPRAAAPTAGNAFIAVLDQQTGTWIPLATTYDAATHQLAAAVPHFSVFGEFVLAPGKYVYHTAAAVVSIVVKAGESGLRAAEGVGDAVWDVVKPEYGTGLRRSLPADERIDDICTGLDPRLPWDQSYGLFVNDENMQVRSCVVDAGANPDQPALLMENDYGFPVDVMPQEPGAVLPPLAMGAHPDQDAVAALNSLIGYGYIPGPGVTQIQFPKGRPPVFYVKVHADWLGLATDVLMTAAAIIPDFEAETSTFSSQLENVVTSEEKDGQVIESQTQVLKIVQTKLKAGKGPAFEGADNLAAAYICFAKLSSVSLTDSIPDLAGKVVGCLKELLPKPGDATAAGGGVASEYLSYLDGLVGFMQLPEVLNDFREHGRQTLIIDAVQKEGQTPSVGADVPVIPCDASTGPRSVALPPTVTLPPGAAVYGTTSPGFSPLTLSIAPVGFTCTALEGGDGSYVISFTAPGASAPAISYGYSGGGAMINLDSVCGYFPSLRALDAMIRGHAMCYSHPSGEIVRHVATGDPRVLAATIVDPPGTLPSGADPSHGQEESVGVVVAFDDGGQEAGCVLPPDQRQLCIAGLDLFVDQSLAAKDGAAPLAAIQSAVNGL